MVECLSSAGPMSPQELAHRVGISEGEAISFLCMLAREKKVAIQLVGLTGAPSSVATVKPVIGRASSRLVLALARVCFGARRAAELRDERGIGRDP